MDKLRALRIYEERLERLEPILHAVNGSMREKERERERKRTHV